MVRIVRKHELLGMKKDVHGKTSLRACSLVPTCGIYLFQYLQVTKKNSIKLFVVAVYCL